MQHFVADCAERVFPLAPFKDWWCVALVESAIGSLEFADASAAKVFGFLHLGAWSQLVQSKPWAAVNPDPQDPTRNAGSLT